MVCTFLFCFFFKKNAIIKLSTRSVHIGHPTACRTYVLPFLCLPPKQSYLDIPSCPSLRQALLRLEKFPQHITWAYSASLKGIGNSQPPLILYWLGPFHNFLVYIQRFSFPIFFFSFPISFLSSPRPVIELAIQPVIEGMVIAVSNIESSWFLVTLEAKAIECMPFLSPQLVA